MFGHPLEQKIDRLEQSIPNVDTSFSFGGEVERHDWRPVWALCKEIQEDFKHARDFESREARQKAWERFCSVRSRASKLSDHSKAAFAEQSARLKDELCYELRSVGWTPFTDTMFFFDPTTVDEIKAMGRTLGEVGQNLGQSKQRMLKSDKDQVFAQIQDKRRQLDHFWEKRREAGQARRRGYEEKQSQWRERVNHNLNQNRERLEKAQSAAERVRERIEENEAKLRETTSTKWEGIISEWIAKDAEKLSDIEQSIDRIRGWIAEGEQKLNS